jgi:Pectate lyase superfamily protein
MGNYPFSLPGSSSAGIFNIISYGADPTGTNDSAAAITAAKTAAGAGSRNIILIPPGTYLTGPVELDGFNWQGYGPDSSILKANVGSANFITNNPAATGERATQVSGIGFNGINLTGTATVFTWAETVDTSSGPTITMRDCWAYNGPAIGIDTSNAGGALDACHFERVVTHDNGTYGWLTGSDQVLTECVAESNGYSGFYINSVSNFTLASCLSYGNGTAHTSEAYGYHLKGSAPGGALTGCHAQDNWKSGVLLDSTTPAGGYTITGLVCDTNSRRGAGDDAAITFFEAAGNYVEYVASDRAGYQLYALYTESGSTGNIIQCDAFYSTFGSVDGWFINGNGAGNTLRLANSGGTQLPAYAATVTPDVPAGGQVLVGTLTGAITIGAPTNPFVGAVLSFEFTQDSTGARAVSWNAAFVFQTPWTNTGNSAGKRSTASFMYDGAHWVSQSPVANVWF